jgi:hypothetical protein
MRLAQGKLDAAAAAIRRSVAETTDPLSRAGLLAAYVEIMLAVGDSEAAHVAARDLERIAATPALRDEREGAWRGERRQG